MQAKDLEYAARSVQRVWRGHLGRKRVAKVQLNKEREHMRQKQQRKSVGNYGSISGRSHTKVLSVPEKQAAVTEPSGKEGGDDDDVAVYTAVKRRSKLGAYDGSKNVQSVFHSNITHRSSDTPLTDGEDGDSDSSLSIQPPVSSAPHFKLDDPLLASHLSAIAEEDEITRDSLSTTALSNFSKQLTANAHVNPSDSPRVGKNTAPVNRSYVADSLDGPPVAGFNHLEKQGSSKTAYSARSVIENMNDVDIEAEEIPMTARTIAATSEADSVEYGQFVKMDRFDDLIAGLGDDFNEWECIQAPPQIVDIDPHELGHKTTLHRSGRLDDILSQAALAEAAEEEERKQKQRQEESLSGQGEAGSKSQGNSAIPRFTSRKATNQLKAFDSDGSLSKRAGNYGEPSSNQSSPPRGEPSQHQKHQLYSPQPPKHKHFNAQQPVVPSVKDLLAVSPVAVRGPPLQNGFMAPAGEDDYDLGYESSEKSQHGQPAAPPASMLSKLEQAQLAYEASAKRNFPALRPQQPQQLILQRPAHSRSNSGVTSSSNAEGLTPPPASGASSVQAGVTPASVVSGAASTGMTGSSAGVGVGVGAGAGAGAGSALHLAAPPSGSASEESTPHSNPSQGYGQGYAQAYGQSHWPAQQHVQPAPVAMQFIPSPEHPHLIPKQGYFKQAQQQGGGYMRNMHAQQLQQQQLQQQQQQQQGQQSSHTTQRTHHGEGPRAPAQQPSSNQGTPRTLRHVPTEPIGPPQLAVPPPLRLNAALRQPAPQKQPAGGQVGGDGSGGSYAEEYANQKQQQQRPQAPAQPQSQAQQAAAGGILGRFSNLPSKLIPPFLSAANKAPPVLAAVKPAPRGKPAAVQLSQTKLTEQDEQRLLREIEELNKVQLQKMQELAAAEEREKAAAEAVKASAAAKAGARQQQLQPPPRRVVAREKEKEVDPIKEKEKRAFKAGAKDVNPAPPVERAKSRIPSVGQLNDWQGALKKDGVEVLRSERSKNGNVQSDQAKAEEPSLTANPALDIHRQLQGKQGEDPSLLAGGVGYGNGGGYLQVFNRKADVKRGGSNLRGGGGHRRNSSGDDMSAASSAQNDAQSEGRLFQQRRQQQQQAAVGGAARNAPYAQQFEETASLPAISSGRQGVQSRGGSARDAVLSGRAAAYQVRDEAGYRQNPDLCYAEQPIAGGGAPFVHPLDVQNRRVGSANRGGTMSAPSRQQGYDPRGGNYYFDDNAPSGLVGAEAVGGMGYLPNHYHGAPAAAEQFSLPSIVRAGGHELPALKGQKGYANR